MSTYTSVGSAVSGFNQAMAEAIQGAVRELLEHKHLYQSVEIKPDDIRKTFMPRVEAGMQHYVTRLTFGVDHWAWAVHDTESYQAMIAALAKNADQRAITWHAPDAKLYCKTCGRLEPFNNVAATNFLNRADATGSGHSHEGKWIQVFVLSYLCQSCKSVPEVFLIRRQGTRLTHSGRAPMEHVPVVRTIPKEVSKHYAGAVVAYQSGQTLAALFLLRTVCEQWAKRFANPDDKADVAIDKYMNTLPDDFKARFPSFRTIYSDLSVALHSADASDELYESSLVAIDEHFAARNLFKL